MRIIAALNRSQRKFNKVLSKKRVVVENAFGGLKGRWCCMRTELNEDISNAPRTVLACRTLHNICIDMNDSGSEDESDDGFSTDSDDDCDMRASHIRGAIRRSLPQIYMQTWI